MGRDFFDISCQDDNLINLSLHFMYSDLPFSFSWPGLYRFYGSSRYCG